MPGIDSDLIKHALNVARQRGFAEVEIETDMGRFSASLEKVKVAPQAVPKAGVPETASNGLVDIKAPLVGYYSKAKPTLEAGQNVTKGDVVAIISALGLENDVETPHSGEIVEVLVSDGEPVQYGQVLARVKVNK